MKNNHAQVKKLLQKLSREVLGKLMTAKDEARFDRQWRKATKAR